jgi:hypothetical protein
VIGAVVSIMLTVFLLHGGHALLVCADPFATLQSMQSFPGVPTCPNESW